VHPLPRYQHLWFHPLATPLALGQGTKGGGSAEKQIETLQAQLVQAQLKGDTSFFEKHYVDDSTIIHGIGKLLTKAEEIANLKSGALKYESYDVRDQRIRVYGDTAVVNLEASAKEISFGKPFSGDFLVAWVWVKQQGGWKVVLKQITRVASASQ
jgi:ketosteroid isomerase-like protein